MTNFDVATKAREMCAASPALKEEMQVSWNLICDRIEKRAIERKPKPKSFEVHHECEVARLAFLKAIVEGIAPEAARVLAANAVGIEW